jgi:hypothetical protein
MNVLLEAHKSKEPPRFAAVGASHVPPEVEAVVRLALSKFPIERQQRAQELAKAYGAALGIDFWAATSPPNWEPDLPIADTYHTPESRPAPNLPPDPYRIKHEFHATMPDGMVAAKIRGFVDDLEGEVLASEPGLIRLRVGVPATHQNATATGSTILNWFRTVRKPVITSGQEPIEMEMMLEKPNPGKTQLRVVVAFRPMKEYPPNCPRTWRTRCDNLNKMLRQYMGA